jgi:hypothetical protein
LTRVEGEESDDGSIEIRPLLAKEMEHGIADVRMTGRWI